MAAAPTRPGPAESAPFYHGYIAEVPEGDVLDQLAAQAAEVDARYARLSDAQARHRYAEGKWSVKEVLGHLIDAERVFSYRMFRIARGDTTPLASFDENVYVAEGGFDDQPLAALRDEFAATRASTVALARTLGPDRWARAGTASGKSVSARALVYITVGHAAHHLRVLKERYGV